MSDLPNVVLVHGAWADGSSWNAVTESLQAKGYDVIAPQFPETSTEDDVARLRQVLARLEGPTVVAGHSYGGQIMTALGPDVPDVVGHFAADLDPMDARALYAVQQPISMSTFEYTMGVPAWKSLPTWFVVAGNDEAIPPAAERQFAERMGATTIEVSSGHLAMVTHPEAVVDQIEQAAKATVGAAA